MFYYTFQNSLGNFMAPNADMWITLGHHDWEEVVLVLAIWGIFLSQAIVSVIILLNFLIAVIS